MLACFNPSLLLGGRVGDFSPNGTRRAPERVGEIPRLAQCRVQGVVEPLSGCTRPILSGLLSLPGAVAARLVELTSGEFQLVSRFGGTDGIESDIVPD